jgi:hypothetical protein
MKTRLLFIFFAVIFLLSSEFNLVAQTPSDKALTGMVWDENQKPIELVQVTLLDAAGKLIKFTHTNDQGQFRIEIPEGVHGSLSFSRLGYQKKQVALENWEDLPIVLIPSAATLLREVTVKDRTLVEENQDTLSFVTDKVRDGTESKLEDVLRKLPGITVNPSDGKILYQGREISALLLDGDDLTGDNYRLLSKGLSADWLDEVQILKRYTGNKLLQGIKPSDEVALNIRLKEDFKSPLFGKAAAGVGTWQRAFLQKELLRYAPKNKAFWVSEASNLGESIEVMDLETYQLRNEAFMGFVRPGRFTEGPTNLPDIINETNFNFQKGLFTNPNVIFRPSAKTSIKSNSSLTLRSRDFNSLDSSNYFTDEGEGFSLVQDASQVTDYRSFYQDLTWTRELGAHQQIEGLTRLSYHNDETAGQFSNSFRDERQQDDLEKLSLLLGSKYTLRLENNAALEMQLHAENQRTNEWLSFGHSNLTDSSTTQRLEQDHLNFAFNTAYLTKWSDKTFSQISLNLSQSNQKASQSQGNFTNISRENNFSSQKREGTLGFNIASRWGNLEFWAGSKIRFGSISWDSLSRGYVLVEPSVKLLHTLISKSSWILTNRLAYLRDNTIPSLHDWFPGSYYTSFRHTVTNSLNPEIFSKTDLALWSLEWKNSSLDYFLINGEVLYQRTANGIFSEFSYLEDVVVELKKNGLTQEELSSTLSASKYLSQLALLIKATYSHTNSLVPLGIEGRIATGKNTSDKLSISTGFVGLERAKFSLGYHFNRLNNQWDLDSTLFFFHNFNATINYMPLDLVSIKAYYEGLRLDQRRNELSSVLSLETVFKPKKDSKWEYKLKWNNVFDQQNLSLIQVAPGISSQTSFPMLQSFLLVQASFGF